MEEGEEDEVVHVSVGPKCILVHRQVGGQGEILGLDMGIVWKL